MAIPCANGPGSLQKKLPVTMHDRSFGFSVHEFRWRGGQTAKLKLQCDVSHRTAALV